MAIGAKRRVIAKLENFPIEIARQQARENLNVLPLGSYDIPIGMHFLEVHWTLVNCTEKTLKFLTQVGSRQEIQEIKRPINIKPITTLDLGKCIRKGCQMYVGLVGYNNSNDKTTTLEHILILQDFVDVFSEEILLGHWINQCSSYVSWNGLTNSHGFLSLVM